MDRRLDRRTTPAASLLALALVTANALACDPGPRSPDEPEPRAELASAPAPASEAPAETLASAQDEDEAEAPAPATVPEDWRPWVEAEVTRLQGADPAFYDQLRALQPAETRAGSLRFVSPLLQDPRAVALLLDRLQHEPREPAYRAALVDAIARTGAAGLGAPLVDLLRDEREAEVRVVLVATLRRASPTRGAEGVALALQDPAPEVRQTAARVAGYVQASGALSEPLRAALADREPAVRAMAARALGIHRDAGATAALVPLLDDDAALVRLNALRALGRVDLEFTRGLGRLASLREDADASVARAAARLADGGAEAGAE
ncbi:MAG: HEAT repeat domain-containing protein [Myxococcales bacterium]|nr:HEAT repeat domain-containing protein [Myxococcales bacterium]